MCMTADVEVLVQLKDLVEGGKEGARVEREIKKVEKDLAALEKKLALPSFAEKAPPEVVAEAHAQVAELERRRAGLEEARQIAAELG
jgi:valyl-tRNA synthetase